MRVHSENEIESRVVAVDQLDVISPFGDDSFQVVAERVRSLTNLLIDTPDYVLLLGFTVIGKRTWLVLVKRTRAASGNDDASPID